MTLLPVAERRSTIIALGLPIVGGMLSQNVLNVVDTAMVGTLGDIALAATGMGGFANFMAIAVVMGLSAGVQAIVARRMGEGSLDYMASALNAGLVIAVVFMLPWSALIHWNATGLFSALVNDPAVVAEGVPYFRARLLGAVGVGINFAFRGYWNGVNLPKLYMGTLIVSHITNLFLNWVLIFGNLGAPEMGTLGAGIASSVATYVGSLTYVVLGFRIARSNGFLRCWPEWSVFQSLVRVAVPASMAQFFLAAGYTALMWIVGQTGTAPLAAANVLLTVTLVAILPGLAFGLVAASLVGQALGRKDIDDAEAWGWDVVRVACVALTLLGLPMVLMPDLVLSGFLHDPATRELATAPLQLVGITIGLDAVGLVLLNAMYGAGNSRTVLMVGTVMQWGVGLPLAYLAGPILDLGLLWMWAAMMLYRGGQATTFAIMWKRRNWSTVTL